MAVAPKNDFVALNLLRGFAALLVLLGHVRSTTFVEFGMLPTDDRNLLSMAFYAVTRGGQAAVLTFFVLSGFLVGGQVIRRIEEKRFDGAGYAFDRISRIFLPLIPACILTAAVSIFYFGFFPDPLVVLGNTLGLNGVVVQTLSLNPPLWTLAYEIWFYVAGGAVAAMFVRRNLFAASAALAAVVIIFCVLEARYLLFWVLGALAVLFVGRRQFWGQPIVAAALIATGFALEQLASDSRSVANVSFVPRPVAEAMICLGIFALIPACCHPRTDAILANLRRFSSWFAGFSFSLYLFHYPINMILTDLLPKHAELSAASFVDFTLRVVILVAASYICYWAFERNTGKLRSVLYGLRSRSGAMGSSKAI